METDERHERDTREGAAGRRTDEARQPVLPFETDDGEPPIDYALTARARRAVAPESLPDLAVVPGVGAPGSDEVASFDPYDSRPARARALRRAGRSIEEVAAMLDAAPGDVARWTSGVEPARRRSRPRPARPTDPMARTDAREDALGRLDGGDGLALAAGGLVAGLGAVAGETVTVTLPDASLAPLVVRWAAERAEDGADSVHVLVAAGPAVARDLSAQRWASAVGLPAGQVSHAPLHEAARPDELRLTVRVRDARVAADVLGWRDALAQLATPPDGGADGREAS